MIVTTDVYYIQRIALIDQIPKVVLENVRIHYRSLLCQKGCTAGAMHPKNTQLRLLRHNLLLARRRMALGRVFLPKKHTPTLARNDSIVPHGYIIILSVFLQEKKTQVFLESADLRLL